MGKAPEHHELSDHEVLLGMLERVKAFVQKSGLHVLLVLLVVAIGFVLYRTHALRRQASAYRTWQLLGGLEDPSYLDLQPPAQAEQARVQDLEAVTAALKSPGDAKAVPWLRMKQASLLAAGGRWDEALAVYERIVRECPEVAPQAEAAMGVMLEGPGNYMRAAELYERLAPRAGARWVDAGRCREYGRDLEGARSDYNRALEANVDQNLRTFATDRLAALERGQLLPAPPGASPAASQAPQLVVPADTSVKP